MHASPSSKRFDFGFCKSVSPAASADVAAPIVAQRVQVQVL